MQQRNRRASAAATVIQSHARRRDTQMASSRAAQRLIRRRREAISRAVSWGNGTTERLDRELWRQLAAITIQASARSRSARRQGRRQTQRMLQHDVMLQGGSGDACTTAFMRAVRAAEVQTSSPDAVSLAVRQDQAATTMQTATRSWLVRHYRTRELLAHYFADHPRHYGFADEREWDDAWRRGLTYPGSSRRVPASLRQCLYFDVEQIQAAARGMLGRRRAHAARSIAKDNADVVPPEPSHPRGGAASVLMAMLVAASAVLPTGEAEGPSNAATKRKCDFQFRQQVEAARMASLSAAGSTGSGRLLRGMLAPGVSRAPPTQLDPQPFLAAPGTVAYQVASHADGSVSFREILDVLYDTGGALSVISGL